MPPMIAWRPGEPEQDLCLVDPTADEGIQGAIDALIRRRDACEV